MLTANVATGLVIQSSEEDSAALGKTWKGNSINILYWLLRHGTKEKGALAAQAEPPPQKHKIYNYYIHKEL